jgi:hypothetical protein
MKFDFVSFSLIYTNKVEGTVVVEELVDAIGRSELCTKFGDGCGWGIGSVTMKIEVFDKASLPPRAAVRMYLYGCIIVRYKKAL